ncbi:uncharacterized protein LOC142526038 [Primulina tabacum]|uniref:uncharacterized protein LOC142526038 n=1 Tax=Primulina tabacum TaxID=48773 RepID=UPI003F593982
MLASMLNDLQTCFEEAVNAADIYGHLQELYGEQTRPLRHAIVKEFMTSRPQEGASVHEHGVRMVGLIEKLVGLDLVIPNELSTDILLLSLSSLFDGFVVNFNMNKLEDSLKELVNMLTSFEATCFPRLFFIWDEKWAKGEGKEAFSSFQDKQTQQEASSKHF